MVKVKSKKNSLTSSLDNKIVDLIYRLLEEKTLDRKRSLRQESQGEEGENNEGEKDEDIFESMFFAKDLTAGEIFTFCLTKDLSLQRVKKVVLQKTIDRMLKDVIESELEEFGSYPGYNNEEEEKPSLEEELAKKNMMIERDTNEMNKRITSTWSKSGSVSESITETDDPKTGEVKKSKKRSKEGTCKVKRQKIKEDRSPPNSSLKSLGGMDDVVAQLMELIGLPILHPEIFLSTGVEPPRGVLLHGPPGCGKTSIANALAGELQVPFISISAPSVVSGMSGESEKKIRDLFDEARSLAPCLVFFDEIDAITPKRDGGAQREMERRIVAQLLTSMDELTMEKTNGKPVIIIGATNRPDSLDAALRRAGRFDREICLNVPNEVSRLHILKKMSDNLKIDGAIDFAKLAKLTPGFVGADLKALVTAAVQKITWKLMKQQTEMNLA
ncbi:hypothetical protein FZC27_7996g4078 [Saccharomyces cerevisiae]|nr:hypothetical protein FZC27_7996g4078 [Saccharomyces cerevisiae]